MSCVSIATDGETELARDAFDDVGLQRMLYRRSGLSESPKPRKSSAITRRCARSSSSTRRQSYEHDGKPCSTSSGSSPRVVDAAGTSSTQIDRPSTVSRRPRASHSRTSSCCAHAHSNVAYSVPRSSSRAFRRPRSTATRRSRRNSSTTGALPALTVACRLSGGLLTIEVPAARVQRVAEREDVELRARQREDVRVGLARVRRGRASRARRRRAGASRHV